MDLSLVTVFIAGVLTFFAPCVLPVYPFYLTYITGISFNELENNSNKQKISTLMHSVFFILGLSLVFYTIGFSSSLIGDLLFRFNRHIQIIGGILLIFMGLFMIGLINFDFLMVEKRLETKKKNTGFLNSFLIGLTFGAGWTPCIGPVLASVYALAAIYPEKSFLLITVFIIGFAIPFLLLSLFISFVNGIIFIIMGILLMSGTIDKLSNYLTKIFGSQWF